MEKKSLKQIVAECVITALAVVALIIGLCSCNVTRTIKTESSYFQKGDTTCTITVKTVETYDASKK